MQYAWLTDIHLNFLDDVARQKFYKKIVNTESDGVLISGDIAEAPNLLDILLVLCGHTHSEANYQPLRNLMVRVGKAEYRYPEVQEVIFL